jgi:tetratricopeptide (TPR) repeat protein
MSMKKVSMERLSIYCRILLITGLSGCALMPAPKPAPIPVEPEPVPVPVAVVPQGTAKELFKAGVDALQHGDGQKARPLLQQVLVLEPGHKNASSLLQQIDANPVEMLGKENFPYKVQSGDTLSLIAKRFLGDHFKFYILARYNDIVLSDNLEAGRIIKIPGKKPPPSKVTAATTAEQPATPDVSNLRLSEAKKLYTDGRFADSISTLEHIQSEGGGNAELNDFLITAYVAYAKKLTDSGRFAEANKLLSKALTAYPGNERLRKQSDKTDMYHNAGQTYEEGNQWLNDGQLAKAYAAFTKTLKLMPDHAGAKAALAKAKPQIVEAYYTDYVRARRRQNFTEAINSLDKLLEIDPDHELAKSNRNEIKAILEREQSGRQHK